MTTKKAKESETKIDAKLKELFDDWCKININYLKENKSITASAMFIDKEDKVTVMMLLFRNYEEKKVMRTGVKLFALSQKVKGYFFCSDTKLTVMNKEGGKPRAYDALVQVLFSPGGSIQRMKLHDGKGNEIKIKEFPDDSLEQFNGQSKWDVFGKGVEISDEDLKRYNDFKKKNPEMYESVLGDEGKHDKR